MRYLILVIISIGNQPIVKHLFYGPPHILFFRLKTHKPKVIAMILKHWWETNFNGFPKSSHWDLGFVEIPDKFCSMAVYYLQSYIYWYQT